ncbi:amidohydrolase family protein [Pseudonocardia kujensis]|uniref:amidohydrolase family protein n=1 Tax=Pseudonocardia kujensis TaxID=1128675 RepID=UPI001E3C4356|nr:amidohydrolase family protein [Pseudonocardia kujensis]MCE0764554.1 amidohydrolase family protein [Pseudonocardia kujensis]
MTVLRNARLLGRTGLHDVHRSDGVITAVERAAGRVDGTDGVDAGGRVVLAGLVDAHVHLDKAYVLPALEARGAFEGGDVAAAMAATRALRAELGTAIIEPGMERVLRSMRRQGTVAARAHVEIDVGIDPAVVELHRKVATDHPDVAVQLVAFPQNGTSHDPGAGARLARALDDGCTVVGGCPYADDDPEGHLDLVFGLAADRGLPVDLHLDLTDDAAAAQVDLVLPRVARSGLEGRVTVGHMTALSALSPERRASVLAGLRDLGISLVAIPTTDLWLSGRTAERPGARGLAPLRALLDAGVSTALASNNHQNAFTPVGGGGLLRVAWLAALVAQIGDSPGLARLLSAVSDVPARILGLGPWGIEPGSVAPLLVLDAEEPLDAVREAPAVVERVG